MYIHTSTCLQCAHQENFSFIFINDSYKTLSQLQCLCLKFVSVAGKCSPLTIGVNFLRDVGPNWVCGNVLSALISVRPHLLVEPRAYCKLSVCVSGLMMFLQSRYWTRSHHGRFALSLMVLVLRYIAQWLLQVSHAVS